MKNHIELDLLIKKLRKILPDLHKKYKVKSLGIFGSFVHSNQQAGSDLDILVDFDKKPSLLKFIELENYLSELMDLKVDLVMQSALKPKIGDRILSEVVTV